ncbi:MAG TPA: FAD-dependent oxidoreductase, partial [Chloroflexota bacterium]|nr:FAD-dependent oxidoreductase [Chloroflexota bacterium]
MSELPADLPSRVLTHQHLTADIVVAGGGAAGLPAALAAARHGVKVLLIQDRHVLGGNSSSEVRMHIVGADRHGAVPHARESGIIEELRLEDAVWNPQRSPHMWDQLLYDAVVKEPNITLLLNTTVDGVVVDEGRGTNDEGSAHSSFVVRPSSGGSGDGQRRIRAITASRPSTEERFTIEGQVFLDCTGDGRLGVEAGADFRMGRESKHEFDEDLAWVEEANSQTLGSSIMFTARKYDRPMPFKAPAWARKIEDCAELPHRPHGAPHLEYGYWWLEWGGQLNTIKDNDVIRHELTRIVLGVWDHIKNSGRHPESEQWALDWVATVPGKRESRRFMGDYLLNQHDLQDGRIFEDEVAFGGWAIDEHPPDGIDNPGRPFIPVKVPLYSIPLRCLYSRNVENLFMAGRNISATHVAFASTRVMATCAVVGQAAGTAAALCFQEGITPRALATDKERLAGLKQALLKDDCYLLGTRNEDPADLARQARVTASASLEGHEPHKILSGLTRQVEDETHQWASPLREGSAWIQLEWPEPVTLGEVRLTFDTGFARPLTLTMSDHHTAKTIRAPQPET